MSESLVTSEGGLAVLTKDSACPSLPAKYRFWGFVICFGLGVFVSLLTSILFVAKTGDKKFAILYSVGIILALLSSFFLWGPMRQLKSMFKKTRVVATIMLLVILIFTLVFALALYDEDKKGHKIIILLCVVLEYCALFWYTLSYIPFARTLFKKCCKCLCSCDEE